jgi:hypothetical protein
LQIPFFQLVVHVHKKMTSCLKFFCKLADKLINNQEGIHMTKAAAEQDAGGGHGCRHHSNVYGQEDPSIQVRQGEAPQSGKCGIKGCKKHSTNVCSMCTHAKAATQKQFWFYNPMTMEGIKCFAKHIAWHH